MSDLAGESFERELEVDLFGLLQAFQTVLKRARERPGVPLPREEISIEARTRELVAKLAKVDSCGFEDLCDDDRSRGELITTFLAVLEMIRLKLIRVYQADNFGPIRVHRRDRPPDAPKPLGDDAVTEKAEPVGADDEPSDF